MAHTEKEKKLLNCLFQAMLQKRKARSIIEVAQAVESIVTEMNGLMDTDGAIFQHARNNGVEKEFQELVMQAEINLKNEEKEEDELVSQKEAYYRGF